MNQFVMRERRVPCRRSCRSYCHLDGRSSRKGMTWQCNTVVREQDRASPAEASGASPRRPNRSRACSLLVSLHHAPGRSIGRWPDPARCLLASPCLTQRPLAPSGGAFALCPPGRSVQRDYGFLRWGYGIPVTYACERMVPLYVFGRRRGPVR